MVATIYIYKKEVDIIEVFDDCLIVQEVKTKEIYTVNYYDIDELLCEPSDDKMEVSNVISLNFYRKKHGKERPS